MQSGSARRCRGLVAATLALSLAMSATGCSYFKLVTPPPRSTWPQTVTEHSSEERCTRSVGPAVLDTVTAAAFGTLTYIERDSGSQVITYAFGVGSVLYLASAVYGYVESSRCRSYQALFHPEQ